MYLVTIVGKDVFQENVAGYMKERNFSKVRILVRERFKVELSEFKDITGFRKYKARNISDKRDIAAVVSLIYEL